MTDFVPVIYIMISRIVISVTCKGRLRDWAIQAPGSIVWKLLQGCSKSGHGDLLFVGDFKQEKAF